jgi:hypothetical protein
MPSSDLELLTVGRISIDLYCDQLGADWHAARTFQKAVGGSPTNVAIAAARLGRRAAVVTKVGEDPLGAAGGIVASRLPCSQAMPFEHEVLEQLGQDLQNAGEMRVWNG